MRRGEIWWASLPKPTGSEPGYRRPVLVISADSYNRSAIRTVVVAPITSNLQLESAPGNVRLSKRQSGLSKASVVNVTQFLTLDKRLLAEEVKAIPGSILAEIESGMYHVLGLSRPGA